MLFRQFDVENKTYITRYDVQKALERRGRQLSEQKLEAIFKEIDKHKDGKITFEEFQQLMLVDTLDSNSNKILVSYSSVKNISKAEITKTR